MSITLTDEDEGKEVVDASGRTLGIVTNVENRTASVEPDPSLVETVKADLGWADSDADEYDVHEDAVESRRDEKLHLRGDL
jgi:hypothetical protein